MSEEDKILEQLFETQDFTDKQKKILTAAIESFSEKGYAQTSTSEIAKKAGVAEGTIFRHYKTKKDLLYSIVMPLINKFLVPYIVKDFHRILDRKYDQFEDFLKAAVENRKEIFIKYLPIIKIMLQEIPFQDELREQFVENVAKNTFAQLTNVIKSYQERGQLADMPPEVIARLVITNIFGYLLTRYVLFADLDWDDEREIDQMIRFMIHGLKKK